MNKQELINRIKTHIAKGDQAAEKSEQHYVAAGQYLKALKEQHKGNWADWETLLQTKIGIGKSRASELMQIADGRKSIADVRGNTSERTRKSREKVSPLRSGEDARHETTSKTSTALPAYQRKMELGAETLEKLKGTSLANAKEQNELLMLNCGAPEGEHTPIVAKLVASAVAGKEVSAIDFAKKIKTEGLSADEALAFLQQDGRRAASQLPDPPERETDCRAIHCAQHRHRLEMENLGLRSEIEELQQKIVNLQSPSPTALPTPVTDGVTIGKSFITWTLQQVDALGLNDWQWSEKEDDRANFGDDLTLDVYDAIVRAADTLQNIRYGMEDVLDAPLTARREERHAAYAAEQKRKAEADEVARLARVKWEIGNGDEARKRYYDEALAEAKTDKGNRFDQAAFDASYKPDTNGQVGFLNPEYGFFKRWYKEHNTIWPGHRDESPPEWDRSRCVPTPEVNIDHIDIEEARKLLDAFPDRRDPQGHHKARIALAVFLKIKPPTPPVPSCDYSIDPIDAASGERGLAEQEWDAVNAEYLAAENALEEKIWRIDNPKEAAKEDQREAERAAETEKRLIAEAKSPAKAKAKALKDAKRDAMADDMDNAKEDARECGERWGDLKDEWIEEWEADNWQPEQIAEAEARFAERWESEHGKAFPASRSAAA